MKNLLFASMAFALLCGQLFGATRYWDNDGTAAGNNSSTGAGLGLTGTWDTAALKWWDGVSGADVAWNNANNDDAVFTDLNVTSGGAPTRTVTISGTVTANSLTFSPKFTSPAINPGNYTLTGGTALNLTSGQITVATGNNANVTISTPITGTTNLTLISNNTTANNQGVALSGANPGITGNITLQGGGVPVASSWALKLNLNNIAAVPGAATFNYARSFSQVNFNIASNFGNVPNNFNLNSTNAAGAFESWIGAISGSTVNLTGLISGSSNLTFGLGLSGGAGIMTLSNNNTYTGTLTKFLNAQTGVIKLGVSNALPTTTGLSFGTGATAAGSLDLNGNDQSVTSLASPVTTGIVNGIANTQGATKTSTLSIDGNATATYTGPLGSVANNANMAGAAVDLAKIKLVLKSTNTGQQTMATTAGLAYSGGTDINGGTLIVANTSGSGTGTGAVNIGSSGTLKIGDGGANGFVAVAISNNGNVVFNRSDSVAAGTVAGAISGTGNLTQGGGTGGVGTLNLNIANTHSGTTRSAAGTLNIAHTSALQNSTLDMNGSDTGAVSFDSSITAATLGNLTGSRNLSLQNTASAAVAVDVGNNNGSPAAYSGALSGTGGLKKIGSGTLTLTGNNNYSGGTTVSAGTLRGTTSGLQGNILNSATVAFDQASNGSYSGIMTGIGSVIKEGSGVVTLTGANVYSGGTTINNGTLLASNTTGSATGSGDVTVNTNGVLGGIGKVGGNVIVSGGKLSPGASINVLSIGGNLSMTGGSFDYEVDSDTVTADLTNVSGNLALSGAVTLAASPIGSSLLAMGTKFTLINYGGSWNGGTFAGLPNYSTSLTIGSNRFAIRYDDTSGGSNFGGGSVGGSSMYVTITAVPEANMFIVVGLGSAFACGALWMSKRCGISLLRA